MLQILMVSLFSFLGWIITLFIIALLKDIPRIAFVIVHYLINIIIFGSIFALYFKYLNHYSPFMIMAIAMITIFILEFVYFKFIYTSDIWFLNFLDWILPAFILASTIYFIGVYINLE